MPLTPDIDVKPDARPRTRFVDLVALGKPRVTVLVFMSVLPAFWLSPIPVSFARGMLALFGINLVIYGANALNMYLERDTDALMARTATRPLPAGRMAPEVALWAGVIASFAAVTVLTVFINPLSGLVAALSLVLYVVAYTPWKRRSTLALLIGAIPGAAPPLLGWTAATGRIDPAGLCLFFILFVWQIPHFLAISIFRRDDYVRAGLKIMPGVRGVPATKVRIVLYAALLGVSTLPPYTTGLASKGYLAVAIAVSLAFLFLTVAGLRAPMTKDDDARWARRVFFATLLELPVVLGAMVLFRR